MPRSRLVATVVVSASVLGATIAGCSTSTPREAAAHGTTTKSTTSTSTDASDETLAPTSSTTISRGKVAVQYPAGGPTDPVFPPGTKAYDLLAHGRCDLLLADARKWPGEGVPDQEGADTTPLYLSAAYVCLGRWNDAIATFRQVDAANPDFGGADDCPRRAVLQWLSGLIAKRQQEPNFTPTFSMSRSASTCPGDSTTSAPEATTSSPSPAPVAESEPTTAAAPGGSESSTPTSTSTSTTAG